MENSSVSLFNGNYQSDNLQTDEKCGNLTDTNQDKDNSNSLGCNDSIWFDLSLPSFNDQFTPIQTETEPSSILPAFSKDSSDVSSLGNFIDDTSLFESFTECDLDFWDYADHCL